MKLRRLSSQRGQGLVEFAVIFPFIAFFLFAILDFGLALNHRATLQHAVREGARFAALSDNSPSAFNLVCTRTIAQSQNLLTGPKVTVHYQDLNGGTIGPGDAVDVQARYTYKPFALRSVLGLFHLDNINMDITGSSRLELTLVDPNPADEICP